MSRAVPSAGRLASDVGHRTPAIASALSHARNVIHLPSDATIAPAEVPQTKGFGQVEVQRLLLLQECLENLAVRLAGGKSGGLFRTGSCNVRGMLTLCSVFVVLMSRNRLKALKSRVNFIVFTCFSRNLAESVKNARFV